MFWYHEATEHTYASVRQGAHTLNWALQPNVYKRYPEAYRRFRLDLQHKEDSFIYRIGGITAQKHYPSGSVFLRANPSAGALYPNELYMQIRGVARWKDGIYHYEVASNALTLLVPLQGDEGIEPYLGYVTKMRGYLFLVSMLYWRSSWKYRDRAFRYCLLDAGHLLGNIEESAYVLPHAVTMRYGLDKEALHRCFSFDVQERFVSAASVAVPMRHEPVVPARFTLPHVDATGSSEPNALIERAYRETFTPQECRRELKAPNMRYDAARWGEAMRLRRSQRGFDKTPLSKGQYGMLEEALAMPVLSDCDEEVEVYAIVHRVTGVVPGIYRDGILLKKGDFSQHTGYLCLEQYHLCADGAVCYFFISRAKNYQALYQKAGILAQRLYLVATYAGFGASGIGAFYDAEVREFLSLQRDTMVLYAFAVGK